MNYTKIIGQAPLKKHFKAVVKQGNIAHAQLFVGAQGVGTLPMAIAFAHDIVASHSVNKEACILKCRKLVHPDVHFVYPVAINQEVKKHPLSKLFLSSWRVFLKENLYGNLFDWYQQLGIENKQGQIGVDEAAEINKTLSLRAFEGGYKVMVIWMAEKMNVSAANKLLKLVEEPPEKTVFILVAENPDQLPNTILSRCQTIYFPPLSEEVIRESLNHKFNIKEKLAAAISQQSEGSFHRALQLFHHDKSDTTFEGWFVEWVRLAFKAKKDVGMLQSLSEWSMKVAGVGRETQKQFLQYCFQFFRQAFLCNCQLTQLVYIETSVPGFSMEKFANFVNTHNIEGVYKALQEAQVHIERNGNAKIVMLDLSIQLTRLLHKN